MHRTVTTWDEFRDAWDGALNFLMDGEVVPFADFELPPLDRIVSEVRDHPEARIGPGTKDAVIRLEDASAAFRALPIERALESSFSLAHFHLSALDHPGAALHGIKERVLDPWQDALRENGFTFERCYPIVFISGRDSASNYHMDFSHVIAWQVYGRKRFCGLRDPNRWAPWRTRVTYKFGELQRPPEVTSEEHALAYEMNPGDVLWNALLTPHWVESMDAEPAMSINLSHGGLRLNGRLCPFEQDLVDYQAANPETAPEKIKAAY